MPDQNYTEPNLDHDTDHDLLFKIAYAQWLIQQGGGGGSLPDQAGHAGEFLTTDGTNASWAPLAGGGDVVASGTLTLNALIIGQGGTTVAATTTGAGILTFLGTPSSANLAAAVTGETGTGALVFGTSPTLVTPALGTPTALVLTNATGLPINTGLTIASQAQGDVLYYNGANWTRLAAGTSGHFLQTQGAGANPQWAAGGSGSPAGANTQVQFNNSGSFGADAALTYSSNTLTIGVSNSQAGQLVCNASLGAPGSVSLFSTNGVSVTFQGVATDIRLIQNPDASGTLVLEDNTATLTNKDIDGANNTITNVAISTAVSGLGTGVATFLGTPSSANLAAAVTDETGSGALVFATSPTLVTPVLGTPTSGTLTNCTGLPINTGLTIASQAQGDILYYNGSSWTRLGAGTNGHYLQTQGAGANPQWAAGGAGGGATNIYIPASAMIPRVTNGAGVNSSETATNDVNYDTLDFDAATSEGAQFWVTMPNNWNAGTVTFKPQWTADSGSGDVIYTLAGRALANDDAIDTAFGTAQSSTDTLIAAGDLHIGPASSAITIGGTPATGVPIVFQVTRDISDTLNADARLIGIEITFN